MRVSLRPILPQHTYQDSARPARCPLYIGRRPRCAEALVRGEVRTYSSAPRSRGATRLVVDGTGCGRPLVDLLTQAGLNSQVLLQTQRLKVAEALPLAPTLVQELLNFRVKIDPQTAHNSYSAWREGQHDDLVLATALACW